MRRAIVPIAIVLALLTGAVLAETRRVFGDPVIARTDPRPVAAAALVREFYAAANVLLATGNDAPIANVLSVGFVDRNPRPGTTPDRAGIVHALRTLRETVPALRLTVLDVVAERDRVAARVAVEGANGVTFLGLPIAPDRLWATSEVFRVEAGQVAERWGDPAAPALFDPLATAQVPIDEPAVKAVTLERWTFMPGAFETVVSDLGFLVLLVDTGELSVRTEYGVREEGAGKSASRASASGEPALYGSGAVRTVTQGERITLRNESEVPTTVLVVAVAVPVPKESPEQAIGPPTGVRHEILAGGPAANLPIGTASVAIGRIAIAAGTGLAAHQVGIAELVAVESGSLTLTDSGGAWVSTVPNAGPRHPSGEPVPAGGGIRIDQGTVVAYTAAGEAPLEIVFVTIRSTPDQ